MEGIYDALRLIDKDDDLPEYPSDDENEESDNDIDTLVEKKGQLSVSDVLSDSQSEEDSAKGIASDSHS